MQKLENFYECKYLPDKYGYMENMDFLSQQVERENDLIQQRRL